MTIPGRPLNVLILANLTTVCQGLSIVSVIQDQVAMLMRYGHDVHVVVSTALESREQASAAFGCPCSLIFPFEKQEYVSVEDVLVAHSPEIQWTSDTLWWRILESDVIFTHDLVFSPYDLPCAEVIRKLSDQTKHVPWYHWVHSVPTVTLPWWDLDRYGLNHTLVYPNAEDRPYVAYTWGCDESRVLPIPNIRDVRTYWDFAIETREFIDDYPDVMLAEIVQVYPVPADRMRSKGLHKLIAVFGELKRQGHSVCLVVADQWSSQARPRQDLGPFRRLAERHGLSDHEVIFTSQWRSEYENGVHRRMLRELVLLGNLFVFPTAGEAFGLTLHEAVMVGTFPMLNKSLAAMNGVIEHWCGESYMYVESALFGGFQNEHDETKDAYGLRTIAINIIDGMANDSVIQAKTFVRRHLNMDAVYREYYASIVRRGD